MMAALASSPTAASDIHDYRSRLRRAMELRAPGTLDPRLVSRSRRDYEGRDFRQARRLFSEEPKDLRFAKAGAKPSHPPTVTMQIKQREAQIRIAVL